MNDTYGITDITDIVVGIVSMCYTEMNLCLCKVSQKILYKRNVDEGIANA